VIWPTLRTNLRQARALRRLTQQNVQQAWRIRDLEGRLALALASKPDMTDLGPLISDREEAWKQRAMALFLIADPDLRDGVVETLADIEWMAQ
jgi:hypothetical protein